MNSLFENIVEDREHGLLVLRCASFRPSRRVLFVNSYGGASLWNKVKAGQVPPHHFWGCLELLLKGYEIAIAEPLLHFNFRKGVLPHDLRLIRIVKDWLGSDGIIYCAHTLLYWLPLLRALRQLKSKIVSLTYAREKLDWARSHSGIIALTPAAADQAKKMAPRVNVAHLGWGADLRFFPQIPYQPKSFLSCGITHRDHQTLSAAAEKCTPTAIRVIAPKAPEGIRWPANVEFICAGEGFNTDSKAVTYHELLRSHYSECAASLIILKEDAAEYTAVGFTNLLEAMAMARPVIVTKTGALAGEIDVEKMGCGFHVPPNNPRALADAIDAIKSDASKAEAMGEVGRKLCQKHYNIERFASELHSFFQEL